MVEVEDMLQDLGLPQQQREELLKNTIEQVNVELTFRLHVCRKQTVVANTITFD
ncbi:hypothetical protein HHI36_006902, partial [Cryptolaemus montrouzieri]